MQYVRRLANVYLTFKQRVANFVAVCAFNFSVNFCHENITVGGFGEFHYKEGWSCRDDTCFCRRSPSSLLLRPSPLRTRRCSHSAELIGCFPTNTPTHAHAHTDTDSECAPALSYRCGRSHSRVLRNGGVPRRKAHHPSAGGSDFKLVCL